MVRVAVDVFKGDTRVKHDIKTSAKLLSLYRRHFNVSDEFLFQYFGETSLCLLTISDIHPNSTSTTITWALSWHCRVRRLHLPIKLRSAIPNEGNSVIREK